MRLHLPVSLFRALLACMAAVSFVSFTTATATCYAATEEAEENELLMLLSEPEYPNGRKAFTAHQTFTGALSGYERIVFWNIVFVDSSNDDTCGGAIYNSNATSSLCNNGEVTFSSNSASSLFTYFSREDAYGGAIYNSRVLTLSGNTTVTFSGNAASTVASASCSYGGAIYNGGTFTLSENRDVTFSRNKASATESSYGGAIYNRGTFILSANEKVSFNENEAATCGGAIDNEGTFEMRGNREISFSGNSSSSDSPDNALFSGAISNFKSFILSGNGSVSFCDNTADSGGAISNFGAFALTGNEDVTFSGNSAHYGGAIYNNLGTFTLCGNGDVLFEKNAQMSNGSYRLRSIYSMRSLNLSATQGKSILFKDSVFASGVFELNQDGSGDIIFTGATTEADLREVKGGVDGTAEEIQNSRTSEIATMTNLYRGRLIVEDKAVLMGRGITAAADSGATVRVKDGTLGHSGFALTFNNSTTFEAEGVNSVTASSVDMMSGSTLSFGVDDANLTTAALTLTGTLTTGAISVTISGLDDLEAGNYTYALLSATSYDTAAWTEDKITVTTEGVSFDDLVWDNGTLYLNYSNLPVLSSATWNNGSGDGKWNATSLNWTQDGYSYAYANGVDVIFGDTGAGTVSLVGNLVPKSVLVDNGSGFDYTFSGTGKLTGTTALTKQGEGKLTINTANDYTGGTAINGGTLVAGNAAALGTGTVTLNSGTLEIATNGFINDITFVGDSSLMVDEGFALVLNKRIANSSYNLALGGSITFKDISSTSDGGAISNDATFSLNGKGDATFSGNMTSSSYGGAIYNSGINATFTLSDNSVVAFSGNMAASSSSFESYHSFGGSIYNGDNAAFTINYNGDVTFSGNTLSVTSSALYPPAYGGGAIYNENNATFTLSDNGDVTFSGNTASAILKQGGNNINSTGGAISSEGVFTLSNNGVVTFSNNTATVDGSYGSAGYGGAICNYGTFTLSGNEGVTFSDNKATSYCNGKTGTNSGGGAISNAYSATFTLSDNGDVTFSENMGTSTGGAISSGGVFTLSNNGKVAFRGNSVEIRGGAIKNLGTFTLRGNSDVTFRGNTVSSDSAPYVGGGAITNEGSATFTLSDNGDVTFSGNRGGNASGPVYGGAINSETHSTLTLRGNGDVLFEKNAEVSNGSYRLRSIFSSGTLNLASSDGKSILFKDSIYAKGTVNLNQDYTDSEGAAHKSTGDIIFTGATTEADLREVKGGVDGTAMEITNSRTSEIATMANLYAGRLIVEDKAILKGHGITAAANSSATVRVKDGTLNHSGYALTFNNSTTLEAEGVNAVTASSVDMLAGSTLSFVVGEANLTTAALTLTGTLTTETISVAISGLDELEAGRYTYALMKASSYNTSAWTADKITVVTDGISFDNLVWKNGTLYLNYANLPTLTTAMWNNGSGDGKWNAASLNWTQDGYSYAYADGVDVIFGCEGAGTVSLVGDLAPKSVLINNGSGFDYTFAGTGKLTGATALTKQGEGKLTINTANDYTGGTSINGGTLVVGNAAALGTGDVAVNGGTLEIAANGFANDTTFAGTSSLVVDAGYQLALSKMLANSGVLTVSGTLNTSSLTLNTIAATHVDVNGNSGTSGFAKGAIYSVQVVNGGTTSGADATITHLNLPTGETLVLGENGVATAGGSIDYSEYLLTGSATAATSVIHAKGATATVTQNGGTLTVDDTVTVTTTGGTIVLNGGALNGTVSGATINAANGTIGATLSGNNTLNGTNYALQSVLANSGVLTVSGTINAAALTLDTTAATHIDVNGNSGTSGFAKDAIYAVTLANGTTVNSNATITHGAHTLTLGTDGVAKTGGAIDYSEYLLTGSATAATSSIHAKGTAATVTQNGGTLTVDDTVTVTTTGGTIALNGGTLNGTVSGATINATEGSIGATLSGNNTLNGTNYALQSVIANSGVLTVSGTINAAALTLDTTAATHIDVNGNIAASGFAKDAIYAVTIANGTTVNSNTTITHGEHTLTLGTDGVAKTGGAIDYSEYLLTGSSIVATSAIHAKGASATVTQNGGTLTVDDTVTVTTTGGTLALNGGTLNGTVSGATINATSGALNAALSGNNTLNGTNYALQSVLANSGVLTVSGTINAAALTLDTTAATHIDVNGNSGASGFAKDAIYAVTLANGTTVNSGATITHGEHTLSLGANGIASAGGVVDYSNYLLADATVAVSAIHGVQGAANASITQTGGTLTVDGNATVTTTGGRLVMTSGTLSGSVCNAPISMSTGHATIAAGISGASAVLVEGGSLTLSGVNTYTGSTTVNGGTLAITGSVNSDIALNGGTLNTGKGMTLSGQTLTLNGGALIGDLTLGAGSLVSVKLQSSQTGNLTLDGGVMELVGKKLTLSGTLSIGAASTLKLESGYTQEGEYELFGYSALSGDLKQLQLAAISTSQETRQNYSLSSDGHTLKLTVDGHALTLNWDGRDGTWQSLGSTPWLLPDTVSAADNRFHEYDAVVFAAGGHITISGEVRPGEVTVSGTKDVSFIGSGSIVGASKLTKEGSGTLTLNAVNSYTGGTIIRAGVVNAGGVGSFGSGEIALQGGELNLGSAAVANVIQATGGKLSGSAYAGTVYVNGAVSVGNGTKLAALELNSGSLSGGTLTGTAVTAHSGTIHTVMTGSSSLVSNGKVTLTGANTYTGATTINGGELTIAGSVSGNINLTAGTLNTATGLALASGQTLYMAGGAVAGNLSLSAGSRAEVNAATTITGGLTLNGGTLAMSDKQLTLAGNLTIGAESVLDVSGYTTQGVYTLMQYAGVTGDLSKLIMPVDVNGTSRLNYTLSDSGNALLLALDGQALTLTWKGGNGTWGTLAEQTWDLPEGVSVANARFYAADSVIFTKGGRVTVAGEVMPGNVLVNSTEQLTLVGTGNITGATSLTKQGSGALSLNAVNTYSGGTYVSAGVVNAGGAGSFGSGRIVLSGGELDLGAHAVSNAVEATGGKLSGSAYNGRLTVTGHLKLGNGTTANSVELISGSISEGTLVNTTVNAAAGSISSRLTGTSTVNVNGMVSLSGANSYTGRTTLNSGTLTAGNATAFGNGLVVMNAGTLNMGGYALTNTVNALGGTLSNGSAYAGTLNIDGQVTLSGNTSAAAVVLNSGTLTGGALAAQSLTANSGNISSTLTGAGNVEIGGVVTISGTNAYTGRTTVNSGQLNVENAKALGTGLVALKNGVLNLNGKALNNAVTATGGTLSGATAYTGALTVKGNLNLSGATSAGIVLLTEGIISGGSLCNVAFTATGGRVESALSGSTSVTVNGDVTLAGKLSHTGLTTVNGGTLTASALTADIALNGGSLVVAEQVLGSGQKLSFAGGAFAGNLSTGKGSITLSADAEIDGALTLNGGSIAFNGHSMAVNGALTLGTATLLNVGALKEGNYKLFSYDTLSGSADMLTLVGTSLRHYFSTDDGALVLHLLGEGEQNIVFPSDGSGAIWGEGSFGYQDGDAVTFDSTGDITLSGNLAPGHITVNGEGNVSFVGSGCITGSTDLIKEGSGTLTMNDGNTYTGGTTINGGTVIAGGSTSFGSGNIVLNNGTLELNGHGVNNDITVENGSLNGGANYGGELTVNGSLTLGGETTAKDIVLNGGSITGGSIVDTAITANGGSIGSVITGSSSVTSTGDVTLSGNNSYTGGTTVNGGTLTAGSDTAFGAGDIALNGGTLHLNGHGVNNDITVENGSLNGAANYGGELTVNGSLTLGGETTAKDIVLNGGSITGGSIVDTAITANGGSIGSTITGSSSVTSSGDVTLSGNNSYTGGTTVNGGTLTAGSDTAFGTGDIALNNGTLHLNGHGVNNDMSLNGGVMVTGGELTLAEGQSLVFKGGSVQGNVTSSAGANIALEASGTIAGSLTLNGGTLALNGHSLTVTDSLTLSGETTLDVSAYGVGTYTLLTFGHLEGSLDKLIPDGSDYRYFLTQQEGALTLQVKALNNSLTWSVNKGEWKTDAAFGDGVFRAGDDVAFCTAATVTISGEVNPGIVLVDSAAKITFKNNKKVIGSGIAGDCSVTKSGAGMLTMNAGNTYSGGTVLNAGTLKATAVDSFGTGVITVNGGTLNLGGKAVANTIVLSGAATLKGDAKYTGSVTVAGDAALSAKTSYKGLTTIGSGSSLTLAEKATMAGSIAVDGGSLKITAPKGMTLAKNAKMTLDKGGTVSGLLTIGAGSTLVWADGSFETAAPVLKGGTVDLGGAVVLTLSGSKAQVAFGDKRVELPGKGVVYTDDNLIVNSGTVTLTSVSNDRGIEVAGGTLKLSTGKVTTDNEIVVSGNAAVVNGKTHNGNITVNGTLAKGTNITIADGKTVELNGAGIMLGTIAGAGTVDVNASIDATAAKITAAHINLNSGTYTNTKGIKLAKGQTLTLGGVALNLGPKGALATVAGSTLAVSGTNTLSGSLTLGGGELVFNNGSLAVEDGTLTLSKAMTVSGSGTITYTTLKPFKGDIAALFNGAEVELDAESGTLTINGGAEQRSRMAPAPLDAVPAPKPVTNPVADAMVQADWGIIDAERAFLGAVNSRHQHAALLDKGQGAAWVSAFGSSVRHGNKGAHHGSDGNIEGAAFGLEHAVSETGSIGLAVGRSKNRIAATGVTHLRQETAHVALYGQKQLAHGFTADAAATYGDTETKLGAASWQQKNAALTARLTHAQQLTDATAFRTFGGLAYEATESGSIGAAHTGSVQNLRGELGAGITHTSGKAHLYAEAALTGDMVRHNPTADLGGTRTHGANPGRIGVRATLGGLYEFTDTWSGTASYGIEAESRSTSHTFNVGVSKTF